MLALAYNDCLLIHKIIQIKADFDQKSAYIAEITKCQKYILTIREKIKATDVNNQIEIKEICNF